MNKKIFYALMASVMLSACDEGKDAYEKYPGVSEKVSLEVVMSSSETTKASGIGGDEEKAVQNYQVLVYDMSSRMLEVYNTPASTASSVTLECTAGQKEIVVLANAPDVSSAVSYDEFVKMRSNLSDNAVGSLVMEGSSPAEITSATNSVTVDIRRLAAKVVLEGINVNFENDAYDAKTFVLKNVYLTNVAADKTYLAEGAGPDSWYNKIVRTSFPNVDEMIFESLGDVDITEGYTGKHHFYCYPNPHQEDTFSADVWSPRPTRLVVEAELGGVLYYYPVSLPVIEQNKRYYVTLNIVRPGATGPEEDMDRYAATFTIKIEEWKEPVIVTETI